MITLSPREREIVELAGRDGKQWQTVADALGIQLTTVRTYVTRILHKTGSERAPREAMVAIYYEHLSVGATDDGATDAA